jgi:hypothetical protein
VINRGNYQRNLFEDGRAADAFVRTLGEAATRFVWRIHAYVVMRNHFHLALQINEPIRATGCSGYRAPGTALPNATWLDQKAHHSTFNFYNMFKAPVKFILLATALSAPVFGEPPGNIDADAAEALAITSVADRDDPEVKAAVDALRAINASNQQRMQDGVDPLGAEEAQLKLERVILNKAANRKPAAKGSLDKRLRKVEDRLNEIARSPRKNA